MSKMKTAGFHSPGLLRLKLGLDDEDGQRYGDKKPKPSRIGLGYHGREAYYVEALKRFSGVSNAAPPGRPPAATATVAEPSTSGVRSASTSFPRSPASGPSIDAA